MPRILAAALTAGALLWTVTLFLAPLALRDGNPHLAVAAAFVYRGAGLICHQRPERSFHVAGVQQPVCARCAGLYASGAAGALAAWLAWRPRRRVSRDSRALLALAAAPTALTFAAEFAGFAHPSSAVRAICALSLGAAAGWIFVGTLRAEADAGAGMRYDA